MDRWDSALVPTEGADFRVGVKVRVYNATLRNGLRAMGHPFTLSAKEMGISVDLLYQYMRFAKYPTLERAAVICEYIGIPIDDVFPEHLIRVKAAPAPPLELTGEQYEDMLDTLTPREQRVLGLRFGLDDGRRRTLEEVGGEFGVTRERVRQIEAKALRKLRHPGRPERLIELWVEGGKWKP